MKSILTFSVLVFSLANPVWAADGPSLPKDNVSSSFHTLYIPGGFDTNDHVQIVGEGTFMNTCYRSAPTEVAIDHSRKLIELSPKAYFYTGCFCSQVLVDHNRVIDLGLMKTGSPYQIVQNGGGKDGIQLGQLAIRAATKSDPDDFKYAPISQAFLSSRGGENTITLRGEFRNTCRTLADVIVKVEPKVIVVQPISDVDEERENRQDCEEGHFPFEEVVKVDGLKKGRYLLHVRSLNGTAINDLVDAL